MRKNYSPIFTIVQYIQSSCQPNDETLISKNIFQFSESRNLSKIKQRMLGMYVYKLIRDVFLLKIK